MTANEDLEAQGNNSVLDIPDLVSFSYGSGYANAENSSLTAEDGGQIDSGNLTTLDSMTLTVDGTGGFTAPIRLPPLPTARSTSPAACPALPRCPTLTARMSRSAAGRRCRSPLVTSYTGSGKTLEATGTGSVLDLSNVATLTGSYMTLEATGIGSALGLPRVTLPSNTTVTADDGGSVSIAVGVLALPSAQAGATITIPQLPQGITLNLASNGSFTGGTTFNVPKGDTVNITGGTFTGGMNFDVAQDATISVGGRILRSPDNCLSPAP